MAEGFNPFDFIGDVANGVGDAVQTAASAAGEGIGFAAGVASDAAGAVASAAGDVAGAAAGAVDGLLHPKGQEKDDSIPHLPPRYSATRLRSNPFLFPTSIRVQRVTKGPKGEPLEGRDQALRMSKEGVSLLASAEPFAPEVERLSISNCMAFKDGKTDGGNPLLNALGIIYSCLTNPASSPILGLIMFICSVQGSDKWYLYVLEHDGSEHLFRIGSKSDGDELLEFLDTYYLPVS